MSGKLRQKLWNFVIKALTKSITTLINKLTQFNLNKLTDTVNFPMAL